GHRARDVGRIRPRPHGAGRDGRRPPVPVPRRRGPYRLDPLPGPHRRPPLTPPPPHPRRTPRTDASDAHPTRQTARSRPTPGRVHGSVVGTRRRTAAPTTQPCSGRSPRQPVVWDRYRGVVSRVPKGGCGAVPRVVRWGGSSAV